MQEAARAASLRGHERSRRAYASVAVPSIVCSPATPISMRRGFDSSGFRTRTSSAPFACEAEMLSSVTPWGSVIVRAKLPTRRS